MCSTVYFKTCIICTVFSPRIINTSKSKSLDLGDCVLITALSVSSDAISCLVKTLSEITLSVSIDMLSLVGYPRPTLLSLQPKINIKESITNVLSIILFIVFKYYDHFIALFFLILYLIIECILNIVKYLPNYHNNPICSVLYTYTFFSHGKELSVLAYENLKDLRFCTKPNQ